MRRIIRQTLAPALVASLLSAGLDAQTPQSARSATPTLPATSPTSTAPNLTAPIAAVGTFADHSGQRPHPADISCANHQLTVRAENSSLNGILRAISRCNGMRISGSVPEQRVFGNYGPADPSTVLATLLDGTGSNMLLSETAAEQPAELILTPRTGGPTPPSPSTYVENEADTDTGATPPLQPAMPMSNMRRPPQSMYMRPGAATNSQSANQTPVPQPLTGSPVTNPPALPGPITNAFGSPNNTSPTAGNYPTVNSVPLDSIPTPSTIQAPSGIVDSPNPPPAGSDTAAALSGAAAGTPGTTNINPGPTSATTTPGGTNTTLPAPPSDQATPSQLPADLTPEQIFQQLQQRQQQQQQQQTTNPQPQ